MLARARRLSCYHECLDASRPWLVYWICSALDLLGELPDPAAAAAASGATAAAAESYPRGDSDNISTFCLVTMAVKAGAVFVVQSCCSSDSSRC